MTFSVTSRWKWAAIVALSGALIVRSPQARAQTTVRQATVPAPPELTLADAQNFLALFVMQRVCEKPLDLAVQNAGVEEVVARIKSKLPAPAPRIEVRDALPAQLDFSLKNSTVGAALGAAGTLAGVQLWVFSDHLLLAPESSLSVEEKAALKSETGREWTHGKSQNYLWLGNTNSSKLFPTLISTEIKTRFPAKTNALPGEGKPSANPKTTFDQLSPDAQKMLQNLVDRSNAFNSQADLQLFRDEPRFSLSPTTTIEVGPISGSNNQEFIWLSKDKNISGGSVAGSGVFAFFNNYIKPSSPASKPTLPPFLDPSAGKS